MSEATELITPNAAHESPGTGFSTKGIKAPGRFDPKDFFGFETGAGNK